MALKAVTTAARKTQGKVLVPPNRSKAPAASPKVAAKPEARKAPPAVKRPARSAPSRLQLVEPASKRSHAGATTAATPVRANEKVRIFQIYYRPEQRQYLDPAFEPYNNEGDDSPLLEFNVFRKLQNSKHVEGADYWGALSWKFREKTGLGGRQLREVIASHPGFDVYYCNPFPELEGLYHNLWLQGETAHPNFLILCREFFQAAGLDEKAFTLLEPSSGFAASNYFVATARFWDGYLRFISKALDMAEKNMSATAKALVYSSSADRMAMHAGASYMPFIIERLFTVYLNQEHGRFKAHKFPCAQTEAALNVHLKLLRQMKDVAIGSKSLWLTTCWINYRNLYLQQFYGSRWCKRYLRDITPVNVRF